MGEAKNLIGLTVLPIMVLCGIVAATVSRRLRDLFFFLLVVCAQKTQDMDVNFVSREWYRGTTRGFEFSFVDILSLSVLFSLLLRPVAGQKRWFWPGSLGLMLWFFFYAAFTVAISDPQLFGLFELSKMLRGTVMFVAAALFVRTERELKIFVVALATAAIWQGATALYQRYFIGLHRVIGIVGDPNSLSMYMCMVCPVFVAMITADFSKWIKRLAGMAVLFSALGVILSISRAGVMTLLLVLLGATAATVPLKLTAKRVAMAMLVLLIAAGIVGKGWHTVMERYHEASLNEEYEGKGQGRGYYLRLARLISEDRWFGVGLNNWSYWVSNEYGPRLGFHFVPYIGTERWPSDKVPPGRSNLDAAQAAPAHNLGALVVGELGFPGLFIFALLWLRWFQMGASFLWPRIPEPMHRMGVGLFFGCGGIFLQSLTEWVFRQSPIYFTFHLMLGTLASLYWIKRRNRKTGAATAAAWERREQTPRFKGFGDVAPQEG